MKGPAVAIAVLVIVALARSSSAAPALRWGYVGGKPVQLRLVDVGGGKLLRDDVAVAWKAMKAAAAAAGVALVLNSAFRTYEQQAALYELYKAGQGAAAAAPGYSDHQSGVAVDVESAGGTNAAYGWMSSNASRFRFYRTVPAEPWHWEYA